MPYFDPDYFDPDYFDTAGGGAGEEAPTPSGAPSFPFVLFRGQIISWNAERDGGHLRLTVHAEDMNRLYARGAVGAPTGPPDGSAIDDGRGGITWVEPGALAFGDGSGLFDGSVYRYLVTTYWPGGSSLFYSDVRDLHTGVPVATLDWQTAMTTLDAVIREMSAAYGAMYAAWWIDADLIHHYTSLPPVGTLSDFPTAAPYGISSRSSDISSSVIPGNISAGETVASRPKRIYIRGGSIDAQRFYTDDDAPDDGGDEYIDAAGALTHEDSDAVAAWAFAFMFRSLVRGEARPVAHRGGTGYHGWRVGQVVGLTDDELSRVTGLIMENIAAPIRQVQGTWIGGDLGVFIGTDEVEVEKVSKFVWTEVAGSVGVGDLEITLWDPDSEIHIESLTHLVVQLPSADTEINYVLQYGDTPPGSLARMIAVPANRTPSALARQGPINDFIFLNSDPGIKDGQQCVIIAQAYERGRGPVKKPDITHIWTIIQDGDSYFLNPAEGTNMLTDTNGQSAVELHRLDASGGSPSTYYQLQVDAVPLA